MRGRRCARRSRGEWLRRHSLARRLRPGLVTPASGGVGAPPGGTMAFRQELADVDVRSFAVADARLWNGADTVARSPRRLKARSNPHPRNARPDAVNLPPAVRAKPPHGTSGKTPRWSAGRRAGPVWPVISGRTFRRSARPRGGPRARPTIAPAPSSAPSPSLLFEGE